MCLTITVATQADTSVLAIAATAGVMYLYSLEDEMIERKRVN